MTRPMAKRLGEEMALEALHESRKRCDEDRLFTLALMSCRACRLMSITQVVDPRVLYDHYLHVTSPSDGVRRHLKDLAPTGLFVLEVPLTVTGEALS